MNYEQELFDIAVEAYVYLYPLVTMDVTRRVMSSIPAGVKEGTGPMGAFHHLRTFPSAGFRDFVRPNFDTLYSIAWLDLRNEPAVVSIPDTNGRYYVLPLYDMWTDVFAVPGKRTSGTGAQKYAIALRGWRGKLPQGVELIEAHTPYVWIIFRTQTNGPADYAEVHKVQDGLGIVPLSKYGQEFVPPIRVSDPTVDLKTAPPAQVTRMPAAEYFTYAARLLKLHAPHPSDWSQVARLKRIGIVPGKDLDYASLSPDMRSSLEKAIPAALQLMKQALPGMVPVVNGWQLNRDTMGVYGNQYLKRAIISMIGLGANPPEDAIYPLIVVDAEGNPLEAGTPYVLHFDTDKLPPASAFWSITMYDKEGFQVANAIDRFAIGDRDQLRFNSDGSLDIFIQHDSPGAEKESNWLPAPANGVMGITMRLYAPGPEVANGHWAPPAIERASSVKTGKAGPDSFATGTIPSRKAAPNTAVAFQTPGAKPQNPDCEPTLSRR